jgi:hypothetical protein
MAARDAPVRPGPIRRLSPAVVVAAALTLVVLPLGAWSPAGVRAAEPYAMNTKASYRLDPAGGAADVTVSVIFENTTPDPKGRYSLFRTVPVAIQDGASEVSARDASGKLSVSLSGPGPTVATIRLRAPLRYRKSATFILEYRLADGASPDVRIGPVAVMVPVWSFGTSGSVSVRLPAEYAVTVQGEALLSSAAGTDTVLESGPIADPGSWLALVTAVRSTTYETVRRSIALPGGTLDLRVRAWSDDAGWAASTLDLISTALPKLQEAIGLPYTGVGPVVVTEALPAGTSALSEAVPGAQEIAVAFNATPFTVLHQVAHIWLGAALSGERWIREGLASEFAAVVANDLGYSLPYDPATETEALASASLPLASWGTQTTDAATSATDAYGYAASWDLVHRIATRVGLDGLRLVLQRAASGIGAYQPVTGAGSPPGALASAQPLDSERFLDQLEETSGLDLAPLFADRVFPAAQQGDLDQRTLARAAYASLLAAARGWAAPEPIRTLMERWSFSDADTAMSAAMGWLAGRDTLITAASAAGLSLPDRLEELWRSDAGDAAAQRELQAEQAFVAAYQDARAQVGDAPNPIERLGLLGDALPRDLLARAAGLFAAGDLTGAANEMTHAVTADHDAQASGVVRLALGLAALAVLAAAVALLLRRLRRVPA